MKINLKLLKKCFFLVISGLILLNVNFGIVYADNNGDKIKISPRAVKFDIEEPVSTVTANHRLDLDRKKKTDKNIYYWVIDNSNSPVDLAEYVMAKTPYVSYYQSLDRPVLFLARENTKSKISLKFRIDNRFWRDVPNGKYRLDLVSDEGRSVKIKLTVDKDSSLIISNKNINILADKGPGSYLGQDEVKIYINDFNQRWNLAVKAEPLVYNGELRTSVPIEPDDIYVSVDNPHNFVKLDNIVNIDSERIRDKEFGLFFKLDLGDEQLAGKYNGHLKLIYGEGRDSQNINMNLNVSEYAGLNLPKSVDMDVKVGKNKIAKADLSLYTNCPVTVSVESSGFNGERNHYLNDYIKYQLKGFNETWTSSTRFGPFQVEPGTNYHGKFIINWLGEFFSQDEWHEVDTGVYQDTITFTISY